MEVPTGKTTKSETKKLYNELIQKDIDALEREKKLMKVMKLITIENITSWIFSYMQAQYLLAFIFTTKMCLKKQCLKEVSQRE